VGVSAFTLASRGLKTSSPSPHGSRRKGLKVLKVCTVRVMSETSRGNPSGRKWPMGGVLPFPDGTTFNSFPEGEKRTKCTKGATGERGRHQQQDASENLVTVSRREHSLDWP